MSIALFIVGILKSIPSSSVSSFCLLEHAARGRGWCRAPPNLMPILPSGMSMFVERHLTAPANNHVEKWTKTTLKCRMQPSSC